MMSFTYDESVRLVGAIERVKRLGKAGNELDKFLQEARMVMKKEHIKYDENYHDLGGEWGGSAYFITSIWGARDIMQGFGDYRFHYDFNFCSHTTDCCGCRFNYPTRIVPIKEGGKTTKVAFIFKYRYNV